MLLLTWWRDLGDDLLEEAATMTQASDVYTSSAHDESMTRNEMAGYEGRSLFQPSKS